MITEEELKQQGFQGTYLPEDDNGRIYSSFEYIKGVVIVGLSEGKNYVLLMSDLTTDKDYACTCQNVKDIFDVIDLIKLVNAP